MAHPTPEQLGAPDVNVAGFQMWVHGRQFPDSTDYDDGNWLRVTAHTGAVGASVWVSGAILMVTDLIQFGQEIDGLVKGEAKRADLKPFEPELRLQIEQLDSLGHFTLRVQITPEHLTQEHCFEFEIDQSYLPGIAANCRAFLRRRL